jgi:hypothetical protein
MADDLWAHVWACRDGMQIYVAKDDQAARYGRHVRAAPLSNKDYKLRYQKLNPRSIMKEPPSSQRIFPGYVVVRNLGSSDEYETWMPDHVFDSLYASK